MTPQERNDIKARERIRDEAKLANELQQENRDMSRTEALKTAKQLIDGYERARR